MKKLVLILVFILLLGCENKDDLTSSNGSSSSIIGRIVDQASGYVIPEALVKIINSSDAYQSYTDINGNFSFENVNTGEYDLFVTKTLNNTTIQDTIGQFSTDETDWGTLYSRTYASITGQILLEGLSDHSFTEILLLGTGLSSITDHNGNFRIDFIFPGSYDLFITPSDDEYEEYRQNGLLCTAGLIEDVEIEIPFIFRPISLESTSDIMIASFSGDSFIYNDDKFYYSHWTGIYSYNTYTEETSHLCNVEHLGSPAICYDWEDNIWMWGDQPAGMLCRKFSISENTITDSISVPFDSYNFQFTWSNQLNSLVGFYGTTLYILNPETQQFSEIDLDLSEFNITDISTIYINSNNQLFICCNSKIFLYDNILDINLLEKFNLINFSDIFTSYANYRISEYNNSLYISPLYENSFYKINLVE